MNLIHRMGLRLKPLLQNISDSLIDMLRVLPDLNHANHTTLSSPHFFTLFLILKLRQIPFWNPDALYCSYLTYGVTCLNKEMCLGLVPGCLITLSLGNIYWIRCTLSPSLSPASLGRFPTNRIKASMVCKWNLIWMESSRFLSKRKEFEAR